MNISSSDDHNHIVGRLNALWSDQLSATEKLTALRVYALCLADVAAVPSALRIATQHQLEAGYPDAAPPTFTPVGLGGPVNHRLVELLVSLDSPVVVERTLPLLRAAVTQEERLHYLHALRTVRSGWTLAQREEYFAALNDIERTYLGGAGLPDFLKRIREDAVATLSDAEKSSLAAVIAAPAAPVDEPLPQRAGA